MSQIDNIDGSPEGKFTIHFNIIYQYKRNGTGLMDKITTGKYKHVLFCGGRNKF